MTDILATDAAFFDGLTNRKRSVRVKLGASLDIFDGERRIDSWTLDSIRLVDAKSSGMRLRANGASELARLIVDDPAFIDAIYRNCPQLLVEEHSHKSSTARIVGWSLAAAASVLGVIFFGLPLAADRLAPLVPAALDRRVGEMVDSQVKVVFGDKLCTEPDGKAAFLKLVRALERSGGLDQSPSADVLQSKTANAIALPGGRVYLFEGLLDVAQTPDEIAGVLGHELGHVHHRDGMRMLIESGGSSFLFGLLFGDVTGSGAAMLAARLMLNARYTREAETRADEFAIGVMHGLGRLSQPMGELLVRVTGNQRGQSPGILASHPFSEDRLARMKAADKAATALPILDDAEWKALKAICKPAG